MKRAALLENLRASALFDEEELAQAASRLSGGAEPGGVLLELASQGVLTEFQAREIAEGRGHLLALGHYRILRELGRGGFGRVFLGRHVLMNRMVAIKALSESLLKNDHARGWFQREVLAATQLVHPNIVMAYDAEEANGLLYFVMEYVDGPTLDALVREHGPLPVDLGVEVLRQVALALQHAHEKEMVHRDIKPGNLLIPASTAALVQERAPVGKQLRQEQLVKVTDFGLARVLNVASIPSLMSDSSNGFLGTPEFVAPEQAQNAHAADIRADIYSLGCTFYYALTQRKPFRGGSPVEVILKHLHNEAEPIRSLCPDIPPSLATIIRRMMEKRPEDRFQTPAEVAEALADLQERLLFPVSESGRVPGSPAPVPVPVRDPEKADVSPVPGHAPPTAGPRVRRGSGNVPLRHLALLEAATPPAGGDNPTRVVGLSVSSRTPLPAEETLAPGGVGGEPSQLAGGAPADVAMRQAYGEWVGVLEAILSDRPPLMDEATYRGVHRELLAGCKRLMEQNRGQEQVLADRLSSLVSPWLGLHVLEQADRATLASLRESCSLLEAPLALVTESHSSWPWVATFLAGTCILAGLVYLLFTS